MTPARAYEVSKSINTELAFQIIPDEITPTLYAMLRIRSNPQSGFVVPVSNDIPLNVDCDLVMKAFDSVSETDFKAASSMVPGY